MPPTPETDDSAKRQRRDRRRDDDLGATGGLEGEPVPGIVVRVAELSHAVTIVALVDSAYRGEPSRAGWTTEADLLDGQRTDEAALRDSLIATNCEVLLAEREGDVVGCCQLEALGPTELHLGMLAVRPDLQSRGIGSLLVREAERRGEMRGGISMIRMLVLKQRPELIAWYRRLGYEGTGERVEFPYGNERFGTPRRDDLEFVVLRKRLSPRPDGSAGEGPSLRRPV